MKKLLLFLLCIFLTLGMITPTVAFAEEAPAPEEQVIAIGSMDVDTIPASDSYTIVDDGETLLEVVHVKEPGVTAALSDTAANGYYTAEFMIPETNDKVFLTGLTQDNADEIRRAIVNNYVAGEDFDLHDLGFIDAEKTWAEDGDDSLCWAAASANVLTYTGWAAQAGFVSTDDLFEAFISSFEDAGGSVYYGSGWFFNGIAGGSNCAQPTAGTGAFLPQYYYGDLTESVDLDTDAADNYSVIYDRLRDGYGVSLGVEIYGDAGYEGGHSVTCWGFVTDIRYPSYHKNHYKSVFITDSDSDKYFVQNGKDRRDADDVMSLYKLDPIEQESFDGYSFLITDVQTAVIVDAITLRPYSADVPYETSSGATLDMTTTTDIGIDPFYLTDDSSVQQTKTTFAPGSAIYYQPYMMNISDVTYTGPLNLIVTVTDADGNQKYTRTFNYSGSYSIPSSQGAAFQMTQITSTLPVGDYTITASFNRNHTVAEAYYYNNIGSIDFKVRESYLLGDADGDGEVSIIDATYTQRLLAYRGAAVTDETVLRGDINENGVLDILDATITQRYLSSETTAFYHTKIGTQLFYD